MLSFDYLGEFTAREKEYGPQLHQLEGFRCGGCGRLFMVEGGSAKESRYTPDDAPPPESVSDGVKLSCPHCHERRVVYRGG